MRALVTGGTGFVGSHLVDSLVAAGHEVTALVRSPEKAERLGWRRVKTVQGDLHDRAALEKAAADQEAVFHVAGLLAAGSEDAYLRVNRDGVENLSRAAALGGQPRFILVSSLAAAGPSEPGRPLTEEAPTRPVTAYGRSKLAGEEAIKGGSLPWTIVRPPAIYGPRDREFLRVFKLARRGFIPIPGDGRQELSLIYGPDLAEALIAACTSETTVERTYNACHPEIVSSRELARAFAASLDRKVRLGRIPPAAVRAFLAVSGLTASWTGATTLLNPDKAAELLAAAWTADPGPLERDAGWRAEHDLAAGLAATAAWYRAEGWL